MGEMMVRSRTLKHGEQSDEWPGEEFMRLSCWPLCMTCGDDAGISHGCHTCTSHTPITHNAPLQADPAQLKMCLGPSPMALPINSL